MASTTPDLRLPSQPQGMSVLDLYQIILLGDKGTSVWTTCPRLLAKSRGRKSNLRPSESQVQRPNHYATRPPYRSCCRAGHDNNINVIFLFLFCRLIAILLHRALVSVSVFAGHVMHRHVHVVVRVNYIEMLTYSLVLYLCLSDELSC